MDAVGIDPGISGAICFLYKDNIKFSLIPRNNDNTINIKDTYLLIKNFISNSNNKSLIVIEKQHTFPGQGVVSNSKIVGEYMALKSIAEIAVHESSNWSTSVITISAIKWQNAIYDTKWDKSLKKERSIMAYKKIFGEDAYEKVPKSSRARKPHLGCIDAALIAYYGKIITG